MLRISASHNWLLVRSIGASWESLGSARDASLNELVVGDFDGDGHADVARLHSNRWEFTSPALGPGWVPLWNTTSPIAGQLVGRFDGNATSDVIEWAGRDFDYAPGGKGPLVRLSRQDMK